MNNIESIKEDYVIGDPIRIVCSLGIKEGYIVDFKDSRIKYALLKKVASQSQFQKKALKTLKKQHLHRVLRLTPN